MLHLLDDHAEEAAAAYVDDLKIRFSSPWVFSLGCNAIGCGASRASHLGIVYKCGQNGKTTVSLEGVGQEVIDTAPLFLAGVCPSR